MVMKLAICSGLFAMAMGLANAATVSVTNPTDDDWAEAPVVVPLKGNAKVQSVELDGTRTAVQVDDLNGDGKADEVVFLAALKPHETKKFTLSDQAADTTLTKRAHAGMFLKGPTMKGMEGPGWESDRIAFRIYWDARNATDLFSKTENQLALDAFASKGVDYHYLTKWGADVLHVGPALGIGGFGVLDDQKVCKVADAKRNFKLLADGPVRAVCDFIYTDWVTSSARKLALNARELIYAGQDWGECQLELKALDDKPLLPMVAGVVRHPDVAIISNRKLGVAGTFGNQALGDGQKAKGGNLGLGVTARPEAIDKIQMDPVNLYIQLKDQGGKATFRYNGNWFKQPDPDKSPEEYRDRLAKIARLQPEVKVEE